VLSPVVDTFLGRKLQFDIGPKITTLQVTLTNFAYKVNVGNVPAQISGHLATIHPMNIHLDSDAVVVRLLAQGTTNALVGADSK
jgi:hypothetical protein